MKKGSIGMAVGIIAMGMLFILGIFCMFAVKGHNYIGMACVGMACLAGIYMFLWKCQSKKGIWALTGLVAAGLALFVVAEVPVIQDAYAEQEENSDYIIILGTSVRGSKPSRALTDRLERACAYMESRPEVTAVVSGGKGSDEDLAEAEVMYQYLVEHGIDKGRILRESRSTTTEENIRFSYELLKEKGADIKKTGVGILSSEYHLHRAKRLAGEQGIDAYGIAADTSIFTVKVNYFIREAVANIYMWVFH